MHVIQREMTSELLKANLTYPVTTILGPRQSGKTTLGKTTLARLTFPEKPYVNMEAPDTRQIALSDPRRFLAQYPNGAILNEIQRTPELLSYIQVLIDEKKENGQYILTGSHQLDLSQEISQSLAGRTAVLHLYPLSLSELAFIQGKYNTDEQLMYGGYPRIYENNLAPRRFYFENLVILELMKSRFNRGIKPNLFFYRDSQKNEVDIIMPHGGDLVAIEVKSSETFHKDFLKPLKKMESLAKVRQMKSFVAYAGTQEQVIQNIRLLNYQNISKLDEWI